MHFYFFEAKTVTQSFKQDLSKDIYKDNFACSQLNFIYLLNLYILYLFLLDINLHCFQTANLTVDLEIFWYRIHLEIFK